MSSERVGDAPADSSAPPEVFSMTGFARVSGTTREGRAWMLSVKSVNHRFLDLHLRMPCGAEPLEMRLRGLIKKKVRRGHLELALSLHRSDLKSATLDREALKGYIEAFRRAAAEHSLDQQPDLNSLMRLPGVLDGGSVSDEDEMRGVEEQVMNQAAALIDSLNAMRLQEGQALVVELTAGMARLDVVVVEASSLRKEVERAYFDRISQRIAGFLEGAFERDRILEEAALLAERSDIEEEITRLRAHIRHFLSILESGGEVGKKLDFLLQEMNREANTLLSKTSGLAANGQHITELGLAMKAEIEKAREQVQNLE